MSMTDPIADMLTRIRNAQMASKNNVSMPHSRMKESIANVLLKEGYIQDVSSEELGSNKKSLTLTLKYYQGQPVITTIVRTSRLGLRVYSPKTRLPKVLDGLGIAVISTSKGVMNDREAREAGVGGEIICTVT